MSKRSPNFEPRPNDLWPTPRPAVLPLIPHLHNIRTFAEPCCGPDRMLIGHLEAFGLRCTYAGDIQTGQDALAHSDYGNPDAVVTNPPFSRKNIPLTHAMIRHFEVIAPSWLLLPLDWSATKQAAPYLHSCSDIVPIGRVKWVADSKHRSMDNFAWYRFAARHTSGPVLHWHGRAELTRRNPATCSQCGAPFRPTRSDARFCSSRCRQCAYRERLIVTQM